jgi:hypothetical protein
MGSIEGGATRGASSAKAPAARRDSFAAFVLAGVLLVAACSAAGTPQPTGPTPASPTPLVTPIPHPMGATDLVLRMEVGGGFVPIDFLVSQAPTFNLYGDGTVIYRSPQSPEPSPLASPYATVIRMPAFRTGRLTEAELQDLLLFALDTGGLRTAATHYDPGNIADAPSTIFTINAAGLEKEVTIVALGLDPWPTSEPAVAGFLRLAERLDALDIWGKLPGAYQPERYRTVLLDLAIEQPPEVHPWPWPDRQPSAWTRSTDQRRPFPSLVMTSAEVAALGIPNPEGGFQNLLLRGPDAQLYTLAVRPLLPDETS